MEPEDLIKYGIIPELVGRLPVIATFHPLSKEHLVRILTEPKNSVVRQFKRYFEMEGVKLVFTEDALDAVADLTLKRKTGARGLRAILEEALLDTMFYLPSLKDVTEVVIDGEVIMKDKEPLYITSKNKERKKAE